jgi:predicted ATP-grasp superfamily ATP-dependent carboligase
MSVIVTNARSRIAYNVVRSLGGRGVSVYAADFVPGSMSFLSRYAEGHFLYPSPFRDPEGFVECLLREIARLQADVLIPVFEETFLIAKHKARFSSSTALVVPDYDQILIAHNKDRWERLARSLGIPVPPSYGAEELRAGVGSLSQIRYPVLVKPKQGGGAWGILDAASPGALEALLRQPHPSGQPWERFFVQSRIAGHTHCVAMLFNHGAVKAQVGYRQLRDYPAKGGQATVRVSEWHEAAHAHFEALLNELRWHGPCQADFIVEEGSGVPYLIDVNPRLWGSITQAIASGVDFPHLIYRLALDGDVPATMSFKTDVVTRWVGGDLASLLSRIRSADSKLRVLQDFFFPARRAAMFDDLSLRDPLPFCSWTLDAVHRAVRFRSASPVSHDSLDGIWE